MKSFEQLQEETKAIQWDFLLSDISTANTFLDVARTTGDAVTRARNIQNANNAYDAVLRLGERAKLSTAQTAEWQHGLGLLKERIRSMDVSDK